MIRSILKLTMPRLWLLTLILITGFALTIASIAYGLRSRERLTCLSFRNITIQLNTNLHVRDSYPLYCEYSPSGMYRFCVELEQVSIGEPHTAVYIESPIGLMESRRVIFQSVRTGKTQVLQENMNPFMGFYGEVSPDERYFAYTWGTYDNDIMLSILDIATGSQQSFLLGYRGKSLGWSADSRYLVFFAKPDNMTDSSFYFWNVDTMEVQFWSIHRLANSVWSPDGHRLAFVTRDEGVEKIAVFDPDAQETRSLLLPDFNLYYNDIAWSPDGQYIELSAKINVSSESNILIFQVRDDSLYLAGDIPYQVHELSAIQWSETGHSLYYYEDYSGEANGQLYTKMKVFDVDRRQTTTVATWTKGAVYEDRVVFYEQTPTDAIVEMMDNYGKNRRQILKINGVISGFYWSKNGQLINVSWIDPKTGENHLSLLSRDGNLQEDLIFQQGANHAGPYRNFVSAKTSSGVRYLVFDEGGDHYLLLHENDISHVVYIWDAHPIQDTEYWLLIFKTDNNINQISLFNKSIQNDALFTQGLGDSRTYFNNSKISPFIYTPDGNYVAFSIRKNNWSYGMYVLSLKSLYLHSPGEFPGNAPDDLIWTQCDY